VHIGEESGYAKIKEIKLANATMNWRRAAGRKERNEIM